MATVEKHQHNQELYCQELRNYLERNDHPEHASIQQIAQKVQEIKARIIGMTTEGKISQESTFRPDKLDEAKQALAELQQELGNVFAIHYTIAQRWLAEQTNSGVPQDIAQQTVVTVITEYQTRWSNMD